VTDDSEILPEAELDARQAEVLRSIIQQHIACGEPVGSRTVARIARLELSAASIRNIMAELEERGLLSQPHTSAGRVPTDGAYRVYVRRMIDEPPRVAPSLAQSIEEALARNRSEVPEMMGEASRQLSHLSQQVGLVLAPDLRRIIIDRLEFFQLDGRRVMAILVGRGGMVHQRVVEVAAPLDHRELERISRHATEQFGGRTLRQMRKLLRTRLREDRAALDRLQASSLSLAEQAVTVDTVEAHLFVEGASNLLGTSGFSDLDMVRALFKTLEEKETLIGLLSRLLDGHGVQVVIGSENPLTDRAHCSLVASSYHGEGGRVMGTVGIVGPTRMPYARVIGLVDYLAAVLTRLLSSPNN